MRNGILLVLGLFASMALSWFGLVFAPQTQLGSLQPVRQEPPNPAYPMERYGQAQQGREVYRSLGCAYCHTQQVRPDGIGCDAARGWGDRRTVAVDYLAEQPLMLGSLRIGPDLANFALRQPESFAIPWQYATTNKAAQAKERDQWILAHLNNPRLHAANASMPVYPILFRGNKAGESGALKDKATQLLAYLNSLRMDSPLYEAPSCLISTNQSLHFRVLP